MPLFEGGIGEKKAIRISANQLQAELADLQWDTDEQRRARCVLRKEKVGRKLGCRTLDGRCDLFRFRRFAANDNSFIPNELDADVVSATVVDLLLLRQAPRREFATKEVD